MARGITGAYRAGTAVAVSGDPGTSSLMHDVLSVLGFDVVEVQHGEQVLDALRLEAPELVVFDGDLPEMNVINFLRLARPLLGARKVTVVLARVGAQPVDRAEGGDLVEVILNRPFSATDLREAVTIARWASDRSNDPRVSGGARPSQMTTPESAPAAKIAPVPKTAAAPTTATASPQPVARLVDRPNSRARARRPPSDATPQVSPTVVDERTRPASSGAYAAQRATSAPPAPPQDETPGVRAPGAQTRFKRTLSFSAAHHPTVATNTNSGARRNNPNSTELNLPSVAKRREIKPTRHDGPAVSPRRRGAQLQPGTLIADRYVVRDLLGTGGMAEVYRAHDRELEEEVALKLLKEDRSDAEFQARFRQEMRICRRLSHPAIVRTYEFGVWRGRRFITMEMLAGEDMSRVLLRAKGPMPEETVRRLFLQVCQGLHSAHAAGVIHRDVKPHNIFVLEGGQQARVMDFGIAKSLDLTTTAEAGMSIIGTPAYLPPERLQDGVTPTPKTDLYSVGASMYHAVTGHLPFGGADISSLLTAILLGPLKPPRKHNPALSAPMQRLILTAMAREPKDRPESCAELADQLAALAPRSQP